MLHNDIIHVFKQNGFCVKKSIRRLENEKETFEPLLNGFSNNEQIRCVRNNDNKTINTVESLTYPSFFHKSLENIKLDPVLELLKNMKITNSNQGRLEHGTL